jgi:hypothetical protein
MPGVAAGLPAVFFPGEWLAVATARSDVGFWAHAPSAGVNPFAPPGFRLIFPGGAAR